MGTIERARRTRVLCGGLIIAGGLLGQDTPPPVITRGKLLEWDGTAAAGELSIRTSTYHVFLFRFDAQTRFERSQRKAEITDARSGDLMEVLSDRPPGKPGSYARVVHLLSGSPPPPPSRPIRPRSIRRPRDELFQRWNMTLAGVVVRMSKDKLTIRTRSDGEKAIRLRPDTRYMGDGSEVGRSELRVNARVFVRAARNFDGEIEAYEVIWGEVLAPE